MTQTYLGSAQWSREALKCPTVSPALADLHGLPPLCVLAGGGEVLVPDVRALVDKARAAGVSVTYHEAPRMYHVYPCLATAFGHPQALTALDFMVAWLKEVSAAQVLCLKRL